MVITCDLNSDLRRDVQARTKQSVPAVISFLFETWLILAGSTDTDILAGTWVIRVHGLCMRP